MIKEGNSVNVDDPNNDECAICNIGGILICCDGCENAYHAKCLQVQASSLPDPWFCPRCSSRCIQLQQSSPSLGRIGSSGSIVCITVAGKSTPVCLAFYRTSYDHDDDKDEGDDDNDYNNDDDVYDRGNNNRGDADNANDYAELSDDENDETDNVLPW